MNFGCVISPKDIRDYRLKLKDKIYPRTFKLTDDHQIKDQMYVSSCTAHAASTILEFFCDNRVTLSTNFLYGIRKKLFSSSYRGMTIRDVCKIATRYGDMEYKLCPGNNEIEEVFDIAEKAFDSDKAMNNAYKHKASVYINLLNNEDRIKSFLFHFGPVLTSARWYYDYTVKDDGTVNFDKNSQYAYHAFVIYGWDEDGWLCQNSWGRFWGNNGLFKLGYDAKLIETFGLVDDRELSDMTDNIIRPTHSIELLDYLFRFVNFLIAKLLALRDVVIN